MNDSIKWLYSLKTSLPKFLSAMRSGTRPGYYSYSLSGDIYSSRENWGLGNTVFASKIYYMLDSIDPEEKAALASFIKSFQDDDGYIYDRKVKALSRLRRFADALRQRDRNNLFNEQTKRAETRQSFAALRCLGERPDKPFEKIPYSREGIRRYVESLNWELPWGAASHISHLVFFIYSNSAFLGTRKEDAEALIGHVFNLTDAYRQKDGSWYRPAGSVTLRHKINAAMKMVTAYAAAGRESFGLEDELIDLGLSAVNDADACDNFNVVCVLFYSSRNTGHRLEEVKRFCLDRLDIYRRHYMEEHGGFSFFTDRANDLYYGARITAGLHEPDIHGTALFLWGITLISEILGLRDDLCLKIPYT